MRQYLDSTTLKKIMLTFVFPYLIYCCEIWGNTAPKEMCQSDKIL